MRSAGPAQGPLAADGSVCHITELRAPSMRPTDPSGGSHHPPHPHPVTRAAAPPRRTCRACGSRGCPTAALTSTWTRSPRTCSPTRRAWWCSSPRVRKEGVQRLGVWWGARVWCGRGGGGWGWDRAALEACKSAQVCFRLWLPGMLGRPSQSLGRPAHPHAPLPCPHRAPCRRRGAQGDVGEVHPP